MSIQFINPGSLFNSRQYGFSQAVVASGHGLIFQTSGQVALDAQENLIGKSDIGKQTRQALANLQQAIEAAGGKLTDVISLRLYVVHLESADTTLIGIALREFFGTENPPASSWIGVTGLARSEFLIEIEANGIIPSKS